MVTFIIFALYLLLLKNKMCVPGFNFECLVTLLLVLVSSPCV